MVTMPFTKHSTTSDTPRDSHPSDVRGSETTGREATYAPEKTHRETSETQPLQSSGDYPTNPTTEHHYGANIGTGVYDPNSGNVAHTTYTISEADFKRTGSDSGQGIHARQYHGPETRSIPVGAASYVHDSSGVGSDHTRSGDSGMRPGRGNLERSNVHPDTTLEDRTRSERVAGEPRLHDRDVQRERGLASGAEKDTGYKEKAHTRKGSKGSLGGLFGHGRQRETAPVGRDTGATGFGGKAESGRDHGQTTPVSDREQLPGATQGQGRPTRGQDPMQTGKGDPVLHDTRGSEASHDIPSRTGMSTAYAAGGDTAPGTGAAGVGSGVHGAGRDTGAVHDKTGRTGASTVGHEGQRHDADVNREARHGKSKPSMMDKVVGNTEAAIGKTTGNASMLAKGEARAAGLSQN